MIRVTNEIIEKLFTEHLERVGKLMNRVDLHKETFKAGFEAGVKYRDDQENRSIYEKMADAFKIVENKHSSPDVLMVYNPRDIEHAMKVVGIKIE